MTAKGLLLDFDLAAKYSSTLPDYPRVIVLSDYRQTTKDDDGMVSFLVLTSFWITTPERRWGLGFGVTGHSIEDAFQLLSEAGYVLDPETAIVKRNALPHEVDPDHLAPNAGPVVVRGVWYPLRNL